MSKALNEVERNYEVHNKEMLAIMWALAEWGHYHKQWGNCSRSGPITRILNILWQQGSQIANRLDGPPNWQAMIRLGNLAGPWTQGQKWYILGGNSYIIYTTNCGKNILCKDVRHNVIWIFIWWAAELLMCLWFVSIWENLIRGWENKSDVKNDVCPVV